MAVSSQEIGKEVCNVLGLNVKKVRKLAVVFEAGAIVKVNVEILPDKNDMDGILSIFQKYKLVPREEGE